MIEINIKPISVNTCWQGQRFKTPKYKAWREEFHWCLPKNKPVIGKSITVQFYVSSKLADLDNMIKPVLDALKENGFIVDDRYIDELILQKFYVAKGDEKIRIL